MAKFTMSFSIGSTNNANKDNKERLDAFELYSKAFNAKKLSEEGPPEYDDIHIMMDIYGIEILLGPGGGKIGTGFDNILNCEVRFDSESEFHMAYDVLVKENAKSHSLEGPYPWATLLGLVVDRFGIGWALYYKAK